MKIMMPDYNRCLVNLSSSILNEFGIVPFHKTLGFIDTLMEKRNYSNIILMLYDGMGTQLLEENLYSDAFLRKNKLVNITTVFPPTTTAVTTSLLSGLNPNEHCWIGWDLYFKQINKTVSIFPNMIKDTKVQAESYNVAKRFIGYKSIIERINEETEYSAYMVASFGEKGYKDLNEMQEKVLELTSMPGKKFIYVYCNQPDAVFHKYGTDSQEAKIEVNKINLATKQLCDKLQDSLVIVTADHGHINSSYITITDYPDFLSTLKREISVEARACTFFVKEEKKEQFEQLFKKYFSRYFILCTRKEILECGIFGNTENSDKLENFIGDYFAIALFDKYFRQGKDSVNLKSMHAGLTEREMKVPIIVVEK